jgi:hypothetical protein
MTRVARRFRVADVAMMALLCASVVSAQTKPAPPPRFVTTRQAPDEFGTLDYTVTTISATAFTADSGDGWYTTQCCLSRGFNDGDGEFYASVSIPTGAVIDFIGLESYSFCEGIVGVELWEVTHAFTSGIAAFSSTAHGYATDYNATPIGYQIPLNAHRALALQVEMGNNCANWPAFTWVEIWWRRTVSPAPANPSFNDVPTTDFGYQFIEALFASGITGGCGGGSYCPDSPVTRRQMAIFLAKALGLHWPY